MYLSFYKVRTTEMKLYLYMYNIIIWDKNERYQYVFQTKLMDTKCFALLKFKHTLIKSWWLMPIAESNYRRMHFTIEIIKIRRQLRQWIWSQLSRLWRLIPNSCWDGNLGLIDIDIFKMNYLHMARNLMQWSSLLLFDIFIDPLIRTVS